MECSNASADVVLNTESLGKIPIIAIMEHASIPWAIKDSESRIVYMNNAAVDFLNLPVGFDFEGRTDEELPHPCSEFAEEIRAQDRKAEASKEGTETIITSYFGRQGLLAPFYTPKFPLYDHEGNVIGTMLYQKKFELIHLCDFFRELSPSVITLNQPDSTFNEKELDILFYAMQRMDKKGIAQNLHLSLRTVEKRLKTLYNKLGINSLSALIEYGRQFGHNRYIPKKLLQSGVNFFW
ncbi:conserved hypothetical protein [Sodalis glossinidius str. 'morsitans']|uniref:HTH luxR-type domain-containing protein n=1 Tax=Sodalis glossinidius (strain morsitans) TaxID=343509 RepID=Q2NTT2_SODGM|nr:PAS domain-containing protein [Sodalis glossinidius]BAE74443.1 conserved hypothetical protein [Sodalis glossinidius str. 'morsitans']